MLLAADIGNTDVVFGLYDQGKWTDVWRMKTRDEAQGRMYHMLNRHIGSPEQVKDVVISSVVPLFTPVVARQLEQKFRAKPLIIGPDSYQKLAVEVIHPKEIGTDLVSDAVAAYDRFKDDCMVIDFGTALTFTIITQQRIRGINIAPGLKTAMKALAGNTVKLPEIPLELPPSVIGTDTVTGIQSGILWGYVGLVEKMIARIEDELKTNLKTIATGGLSKVLGPLHDQFDVVEPNLTLEGMRLIYLANR